jgi:MOSC domain-containing protein YiiM
VTTKHGGVAGLYTVVLVEGMVAPGDVIELV